MQSVPAAGALLVIGSVTFLCGAAIGLPRVFTEPDPETRLRMLEQGIRRWRAAQPLYGLGPLLTAVGVGLLATADNGATDAVFVTGGVALLAGGLAWCRSLYLRATRVRDFAHGALPGWPFTASVLLTIGGLAPLGLGLLAADYPSWLGWVVLGWDVVFLAGYLWAGDIPPFVFYLLLLVVGVAVA